MKIKIGIVFILFCILSYSDESKAQTSFKVCDVEKATEVLVTSSYFEAIKSYTLSRVEEVKKEALDHNPKIQAHATGKGKLIPGQFHPLVQAVYLAYKDHRPLVLSPDMVWLSLTQGFALHINENAEKLRDKLVHFEGKKQIDVSGGGSMQALDNEGWAKLLPKFEDKIAEEVGKDLANLVNAKFSTTQLNETVAFQITLMDALSEYFAYSATFSCGIPEIILEGTPEDWEIIEKRIKAFEDYELDWWIKEVKPILKEFTLASSGKVNKDFWSSIFQINTINMVCYQEQYVTGWISKFFPYIKGGDKYIKNPMLEVGLDKIILKNKTTEVINNYQLPSLQTSDFPSGISKAEILCNDNGIFYDMHFYAGFLGIKQDTKTLALRPEIAWLVYDTGKKPNKERIEEYWKAKEGD